MTGHLVLATMHTIDTISAVMRLLDMQVKDISLQLPCVL